jgi:kynurenine formamidase
MDCPLHVQENTHDITGFPLSSLFGTGMVVSIPKGKWEVITPQDLENVEPPIQRGDIVIINTGYHKKYSDSAEYFHYGPGLYLEAAQWLVERGVKMVAIDVQALDHPLGTYIADHGPGPMAPHLNDEYKAETGRDILQDFPLWEPAHKTLLCNGIPGVENAGGDLDALTGKRMTFMAFPLRWEDGDGSVVRLIGIEDPSGSARL